MIVQLKEINKRALSILHAKGKYKDRTRKDAYTVSRSIVVLIKKSMLKTKVISFGYFWLYPKKADVFRRRNKTRKL